MELELPTEMGDRVIILLLLASRTRNLPQLFQSHTIPTSQCLRLDILLSQLVLPGSG
jgi:hypothetical protein